MEATTAFKVLGVVRNEELEQNTETTTLFFWRGGGGGGGAPF